MIDLILFAFFLAVFAAGFWAGAKFGTYSYMLTRGKAWVKSFLS